MFGDPFINCVILCSLFLLLNIKQIGLKGKSIVLPSTIFAFMWGWTSLGIVILKLLNKTSLDSLPSSLIFIGNYEFNILLVCFASFLTARFATKKYRFISITSLSNNIEIPYLVKRLRWILYLFCFLGIIRLGIVISSTGFNMSAMRAHYLSTRAGFGVLDTNLIRITQYVLQFAIFYVCLLGLNASIYGLNLKQTIKDFIIFMPYQFSFGGRLYILSFFIPFFISYLGLHFTKPKSFIHNKTEIRKIGYLIGVALMLIVIMQIFKTGRTSNEPDVATGGELFYSTTSYVRMYSLLEELPEENKLKLGYGRNISPWFTTPSKEYTTILKGWEDSSNPALVCVPSMIPDMYLDFGKTGSYFLYFIIFFLIEYIAIKSMRKYSFRNFVTYVLLCIFTFNTVTSSMSDNFKSLFVGLIFLFLFTKLYLHRIKYANIQS